MLLAHENITYISFFIYGNARLLNVMYLLLKFHNDYDDNNKQTVNKQTNKDKKRYSLFNE